MVDRDRRKGPRPGIAAILAPKWRGAAARLRQNRSGLPVKVVVLGAVALGFWSALFLVACRVLRYTRAAPEIGALLPGKMLAIILLVFSSILLLSNIITALSTFFLAKDLDTLMAAPINWPRLYLAKLTETAAYSSWMVALLAVPIFSAYGTVYGGGPLFPLVAVGAFLPFLVFPAVLGSAITLVLVNVFPARRARELLSLVAIAALGGAVVLLRVLRPERLAQPEGYGNLVDFLVVLRTPTSPLLPSEWTARMVMNWLERVADPTPVLLLWTLAPVAIALGALLHGALYRIGFARAQEGAERLVRAQLRGPLALVLRPLPVSVREMVLKDTRLFFRDAAQWSQLLLVGVLLVVYVFNIQALPLFSGERVTFFMVTAIVFLNIGLAGFVLAAIAARFILPAISLEGRQLWLLRSSPLDLRQFLRTKYWVGTLPLLLLGLVITSMTAYLLRASPFMMALSVGTIVLFTLAASALALACGTVYPQLDSENPAQISTSFGGLVFMMASVSLLVLLIAIEAHPVLGYIRAHQAGESLVLGPDMALALVAVVVLCVGTAIGSLRVALSQLQAIEH